MSGRDIVIFVLGTLLGTSGIVVTLIWSIRAGIVALLSLALLLLVVLFLQRRQLARIQQRTLDLIRAQETARQKGGPTEDVAKKILQAQAISTKKIIGLLEAQQISMERLSDKIDRHGLFADPKA